MTFKDEIYANYVKHHNVHLYGNISINRIKNNYFLWDYYFDRFLPKNKSIKILDIGCGEGAFVQYLFDKGYSNSEGFDISEEQINLGQSLGIKNIYTGDIFNILNNCKKKYDLIIARDVLEHFSKQEVFDILKLANSSLEDKGKMMIQVPNGEGIWHEKIFYGDYTHETLFTKDSARQVLLSTGSINVNSYPLEFPATNIKSYLRKIIWKLMLCHQKFRKWIATGDSTGIFSPNMLIIAEK